MARRQIPALLGKTQTRFRAARHHRASDRCNQRSRGGHGLQRLRGSWRDSDNKGETFTEASASLNPGLNGRDIRAAFTDDDCKLLLVANKFQTGFDQPLLCGMYIDRRLAGIQAVQTLSRLNRATPARTRPTFSTS